jgi:SAM-dependent methyltransferase
VQADEIRRLNREAWDRKVADGSMWTVPVDAATVAAAREDRWSVLLTATRPVPREWFPPLPGCRVLCLASAGGQQGPVLAAAGARVTVLDNSPAQLGRDAEVARREGLDLRLVEGDMADLSALADGSFDLVFNPVSTCFAPELKPIWREAARVLRPGGALLAGHMNPAFYVFDMKMWEQGELVVRHTLPHADAEALSPAEVQALLDSGEALEFGHVLADQIGAQLAAGFALTGFYEDVFPADAGEPLSRYMPTMFATKGVLAAES